MEEFALIHEIMGDYQFISMDIEFPGIVFKLVGYFRNYSKELKYLVVKCNVDILNLIQVGFTFSDEDGNLPHCDMDKHYIWQFNFHEFNLVKYRYVIDSV